MINIYTGSSLISIKITQFVEIISQVCIRVSKNLQTCYRQTQTLAVPRLSVCTSDRLFPVCVCPSLLCPSLYCPSSTSILSYAVLTSASLSLSLRLLVVVFAVEGQWLDWAAWSQCSVSCGSGTQQRQRRCSVSVHGWAECKGQHEETRECTNPSCGGRFLSGGLTVLN